MATLQEVTKTLNFLMRLYPYYARQFSRYKDADAEIALTCRAYHVILGDLPAELLQNAAAHLAGRAKFFPAAAELREAVFEFQEMSQGVPSAYDAWAEVTQAFGTHGRDRLPEWTHELIGMAVKGTGGWRALCDSPVEMVAADRARFIQAYQTFLSRAQTETRMLPEVRRAVEGLPQSHRPGMGAAGDETIAELEGGEDAKN